MIEGLCHGCRDGMHELHVEYPEIPSEGVMGGWHCPCEGDCRAAPEPGFIGTNEKRHPFMVQPPQPIGQTFPPPEASE